MLPLLLLQVLCLGLQLLLPVMHLYLVILVWLSEYISEVFFLQMRMLLMTSSQPRFGTELQILSFEVIQSQMILICRIHVLFLVLKNKPCGVRLDFV